MQLKNVFHIPIGEKITEKAFARVLLSSVCGILLCMGCLVGTTWAWFVATVESTDNVIEIATVAVDATVRQGDTVLAASNDGSYTLPIGNYAVQVRIENNATHSTRPVYVLATVTQNEADTLYYLVFENGLTEADVNLTVEGSEATVHFTPLWTQPAATPLVDEMTVIGETVTESTTTTSTTSTTTIETTTQTTEATATTAPTATETEPTTTEATAAETTATYAE